MGRSARAFIFQGKLADAEEGKKEGRIERENVFGIAEVLERFIATAKSIQPAASRETSREF